MKQRYNTLQLLILSMAMTGIARRLWRACAATMVSAIGKIGASALDIRQKRCTGFCLGYLGAQRVKALSEGLSEKEADRCSTSQRSFGKTLREGSGCNQVLLTKERGIVATLMYSRPMGWAWHVEMPTPLDFTSIRRVRCHDRRKTWGAKPWKRRLLRLPSLSRIWWHDQHQRKKASRRSRRRKPGYSLSLQVL
jgi:hypothetical protein